VIYSPSTVTLPSGRVVPVQTERGTNVKDLLDLREELVGEIVKLQDRRQWWVRRLKLYRKMRHMSPESRAKAIDNVMARVNAIDDQIISYGMDYADITKAIQDLLD